MALPSAGFRLRVCDYVVPVTERVKAAHWHANHVADGAKQCGVTTTHDTLCILHLMIMHKVLCVRAYGLAKLSHRQRLPLFKAVLAQRIVPQSSMLGGDHSCDTPRRKHAWVFWKGDQRVPQLLLLRNTVPSTGVGCNCVMACLVRKGNVC